MSDKFLSKSFIAELLKLSLRNSEVLAKCSEFLKYNYIPIAPWKEIWKTINTYYLANKKAPTLGILSQFYQNNNKEDLEVLKVINEIKEAENVNADDVLKELTSYIKNSMAIEFYDHFPEIYNKGEREKAISALISTSHSLENFTLMRNESGFNSIFSRFGERQFKKQIEAQQIQSNDKFPFSIDELDSNTFGGINIGDTALFLAQSGIGKTKLLRHIGIGGARKGFKILHIQLEGSEKECEDGYDASWTAIPVHELEYSALDESKIKELNVVAQQVLNEGGEIFIKAFETFNSATIDDIREIIFDFYKIYGVFPDAVLIDYFELVEASKKKKFRISEERQRREHIANGMKNIALECKTRIITCTQGSTVDSEQLNNPDFVMTRFHISEFKGAIKPFSYFFTLNQTEDEYKVNMMRIFADKVRKYKRGWIATIFQKYSHDRFYDRKKTLEEIYNLSI